MNSAHVYLLDSEGLSRLARGDRVLGAQLKHANRRGIRVMTTSMALIAAYHDRVLPAAWSWALSRIHVEPVTEETAKAATDLLRETGLYGHRYAIDAALAAVALRQREPVTVFTSDEDDLRTLCGDRVGVVKL